MVSSEVSRYHDPGLAVPGHASLLAELPSGRVTLHCADCGWSGGSFRRGRWQEQQINRSWAAHEATVAAGMVIEHGLAVNVPGNTCFCVTCKIACRQLEREAA